MTVNPSSADGLAARTPAQIALSRAGSPSCPDASTLGSVTIDTPLLAEPLRGSAYLAAQDDNPFGTTLAMYLVAQGDGVVVKLRRPDRSRSRQRTGARQLQRQPGAAVPLAAGVARRRPARAAVDTVAVRHGDPRPRP